MSFGRRRRPKRTGKEQGKKENKKLDLQNHWKLETIDCVYFILFYFWISNPYINIVLIQRVTHKNNKFHNLLG